MAGESRRQRRDARRAADDTPSSAHPSPQPVVAGGEFASVALPVSTRRRFSFIHESIAELRKVEWPNRAQVIQGTIVVIIACAVIGLFLWVADLGLKPFVRDVLLNR